MSSQQTTAYLARIRDRIAAIRQSTNTSTAALKTKISNTVRGDGLGRRGESARQTLAACIGEYYDGAHNSEDDLRDASPVEGYWHGENGEDADWDGRSDSMEPLGGAEDGEEIAEGGDGHREDWELDMDREDGRCLEVDRSMDLESLIAEERFLTEEMGDEIYVAYHSLNSRAMRKLRLDEVERMYQSGERYSTVGKKKGREIQNMLQKFCEEAPIATRQEDEETIVSNPYPEDDDLLPLTRQPHNRTPPSIPQNPNKANTSSSSALSSNPYPEDAPTSLHQPPPPTQSPYPPHRPITSPALPTRFTIYPPDRTVSPITQFIASRQYASPAPSSSIHSYQPSVPGSQSNVQDNVDDYASTHPYHGMDHQEAQEYWHDLQTYNTESERHLRQGVADGGSRQRAVSSPVQYCNGRVLGSAGEDYELNARDDATENDQREQTGAKKVNMVGRLFNTFTCRPGAVTPLDDATVPVKNDARTGMISIVPKRYAIAHLSRKRGRTQRKEEDARLKERLLALQPSAPNEETTRHIEHTKQAVENAQQAGGRCENTQRRTKPRVVNVESQTRGVIGPPVDLSKMIQRAPESIRTASPLPRPDNGPEGIREDVQHAPRETHSDSSSSLSDRLRQTKLEDLPLRLDAAQEIRNLMLDLERDQNGPNTTPTQQRVGQPGGTDSTIPSTERVNELLPGGFSRPATISTTTSSSSNSNLKTTPSPRETLEQHFRTQRQANQQYARRVRAARSHSSNLTLPRSFRAPEMHNSMLSIPREPSPLVQMASVEDLRATSSAKEGVGSGGGEVSTGIDEVAERRCDGIQGGGEGDDEVVREAE